MPAVKRGNGVDEATLKQAVERAQAGEAHALEDVVYAVRDDVFRLALRMTAHPEDAEDATQEILIKPTGRTMFLSICSGEEPQHPSRRNHRFGRGGRGPPRNDSGLCRVRWFTRQPRAIVARSRALASSRTGPVGG